MPNTASKTAGRNGTRAGTGNRTQRTGGTRPRAGAAAVRDDEQETKSQYGGAEGNEKALAYISDYILNGGKDTKEAWEHAKTLDPTYKAYGDVNTFNARVWRKVRGELVERGLIERNPTTPSTGRARTGNQRSRMHDSTQFREILRNVAKTRMEGQVPDLFAIFEQVDPRAGKFREMVTSIGDRVEGAEKAELFDVLAEIDGQADEMSRLFG